MRRLVLLTLAVAAMSTLASSQDCLDYGQFLKWCGSIRLEETASAVCVRGDLAYAGSDGFLQVVDVADPYSPLPVGLIEIHDTVRGLDVVGDLAHLVGDDGLQMIDVSDPTTPLVCATLDLAGCRRVSVSGDYAYVARGPDHPLTVVDISDPQSPFPVAQWGSSIGVLVHGSLAILWNGSAGLNLVDTTDPETPQFISGLDLEISDLALQDNLLYCSGDEFKVVDIADPAHPFIVNPTGLACPPGRIAVEGNTACIATGNAGVQFVDVHDAAAPELTGSYDLNLPTTCVSLAGGLAHVVTGDGSWQGHLHIIDASSSEIPEPVADVGPMPDARRIAIYGTLGCVAAATGMHVIDLTDPDDPEIVGAVQVPGGAKDIDIAGDHAYVAAGEAGFHVVDISDPMAPVIVGTAFWDTYGATRARNVTVVGVHAFVADAYLGLAVIDISDPSSPIVVGTAGFQTTYYESLDVAVDGSHAYLTGRFAAAMPGPDALLIVDISRPDDPFVVAQRSLGHIFFLGTPVAIEVANDFVYIATERGWGPGGGLALFHLSMPDYLHYWGAAEAPGGWVEFALADGIAYMAAGETGVHVIDVAAPWPASIIGTLDTPGIASGVAVSGDYVYVADVSGGIQVAWRQCDETVAVEDQPGSTHPLADLPDAGQRLDIHPNPFNPRTTISFSCERSDRAEISVYELTGRRITVLADRVFAAGAHSVGWNGRDAAGRSVPSGTYVVRLRTQEGVQARKVMLVR